MDTSYHQEWKPIVGLDTSTWGQENLKPQKRAADLRGNQQKHPEGILRVWKNFDAQATDDRARAELKRAFSASESGLLQFAQKTQYFILRH